MSWEINGIGSGDGVVLPPFYAILDFYSKLLDSDVNIVYSGSEKYDLSELDISITDCKIGDVIEVNTSISIDYIDYNDIGDIVNIIYGFNGGTKINSVTSSYISGGDNSSEIGHGNLYTPFLVTADGTCNISVVITLVNKSSKVCKANSSGILIKKLRKII